MAHEALLSMGFPRQQYWSGLPFPSPGDLPNPGIEPRSPALEADALPSEPTHEKGDYVGRGEMSSWDHLLGALAMRSYTEKMSPPGAVGSLYFTPEEGRQTCCQSTMERAD